MARKYIGWTERGPAVYRNVRKDRTGDPLILLDDSETTTLVLDLTGYIDTGETISTCTADTASCACTPTVTSSTISLALSGATSYSDGYAALTITLSSGEVILHKLRIRRPNRFGDEAALADYV